MFSIHSRIRRSTWFCYIFLRKILGQQSSTQSWISLNSSSVSLLIWLGYFYVTPIFHRTKLYGGCPTILSGLLDLHVTCAAYIQRFWITQNLFLLRRSAYAYVQLHTEWVHGWMLVLDPIINFPDLPQLLWCLLRRAPVHMSDCGIALIECFFPTYRLFIVIGAYFAQCSGF